MTVRYMSAKAVVVLTLVLAAACGENAPQVSGDELPHLESKAQAVVANKVLILASSVTNGTSSQEARAAAALGYTVDVVTPTTWAAKTAADFATYRAIILGDPMCGGSSMLSGSLGVGPAVTNRATWGPMVNGNVIVVGTAPVFHQGGASGAPGPVTTSAIKFATAQADKTGMYISLSCYYGSAPAGTAVTLLEPFGSFAIRGTGSTCWTSSMHMVAGHPMLADMTDASLSNWSCSAHEVFDSFPAGSFSPVAIARDASDTALLPISSAFGDGSHGAPYILARGVTPMNCGNGVVDPGEQCDSGANNSAAPGSACSTTCMAAWCGDGIVQAGEACDDGAANGPGGSCTMFCRATQAANRPPVAICKALTLSAGPVCGVTGNINDGSYDPDGTPVDCTMSPAGPWAPGTRTVLLTCRDSGGLTSSCSTTVTVNDTTAPVITCPANRVVECVGGRGDVSPGVASLQDNCSGASNISTSSAVGGYPMGVTEVTFSGADSAGNSASCTSTITVQDTQGPSIALNGSSSAFLECALDPYTELGATATDLCYGDASGTLTINGTVNNRAPGSYLISYSAVDPNGLRSTVYRDVVVQDSKAPVITVKGGTAATVECGSTYAEQGATATDICSGDLTGRVQISNPVNAGIEGVYNVEYSVFDAAENFARATRTVTVADTIAPTISCPASQAVECVAGTAFVDPGAAVASDSCALASVTTHEAKNFNKGATDLVYTATDRAGHTASCTTRVTVRDTLPPSVTMNGNVSPVLECGVDAYVEAGAVAVDACNAQAPAISTAGTVNTAAVGTYPISYSATDESGNVQTVTRTVRVNDSRAPAITLAGSPSVNVECGIGSYVEAGASASDLCAGNVSAAIAVNASAINTRSVGSYPVSYSVVDPSGNVATASRTVNVQDTLSPSIALLGSPAPMLECGVDTFVEPGAVATDACAGDVSGTITRDGAVNPAAVGIYTLGYTARDPAGHISGRATRAVTVRDTRAPDITLSGQSSVRLECGVDTYVEAGAAAADTCDRLAPAVTAAGAVNTAAVGTYQISYSAVDSSGNTRTATRSVQVGDSRAPAITLVGSPSVTLECGISSYVEAGATAADSCAGNVSAALAINSSALNLRAVGSYPVSYSVTDPSGNVATASRTVNVQDTLAPSVALVGNPAPVLECGVDTFVEPGAVATDACAGDVSSTITRDGAVNPVAVGIYTLGYTARDPSGHISGRATRAVTVRDTRAPAVTLTGPASVRLECGVDSYSELGASAMDTCGGNVSASITTNASAVNTRVPGSYQVSYTATDASGNAATAARTVTVADGLDPVLTLNGAADITLSCGATSFTDPGATATDACSGNLTSSIVRTGTVDATKPGTYTLTYTVTDGAGRSVSKTRTVKVNGATPQLNVATYSQLWPYMWPPNHDYHSFTLADCASISYAGSTCGGSTDVNTMGHILSISSDEPDDGTGDGHTTSDILINSASSFQLRNERMGTRNGRVYTVNFYVLDSAGNRVNGACKFPVLHDASDSASVDDGPTAGFTVTSRFP